MTNITIELPVPTSNEAGQNARMHWAVRHKNTARLRETAALAAKAALKGEPAPKWVKATVHLHAHVKRVMDPINLLDRCKAYFDGFEDAQIIVNDSGLWPERPTIEKDLKNPRIVFTIKKET
jgi:hypothetical protein